MSIAEIVPNSDLITCGNAVGFGGLRSIDGRVFPLTRMKVRASLAGPCAQTVVEQHFANPFDETLDVTWIFPLPSEGALVHLELVAGDIVVKGECQELAQARATFEAARELGKRTALVEKAQAGVHTLSLAGLPPGGSVTVRLTLVELLPASDGRFRWHFPTTIAPRYTPGNAVGHSGFGTEPDTDAVPNASRLSPPIRIEGGTELDLEVEIAGPLTSLQSSLHAVKLALDNGSVRVAPSARATMNKDFILEFSTAESSSPVTRAWTDGTHTLVLVEPPTDFSGHGLPRDAVFVVDISGSMAGPKLQAAKTALIGALHGLQGGDRFKLLAFDDRVERFSAQFTTYDDKNVAAADRWIGALTDRGGTEMLQAIQESLEGETPAGRLRTVLFITDGQSSDEARLLPAVANRKGASVFFTLGIDTAVNEALLKSLARVGGGPCELCAPGDDIDAVVARLELRFGSALLSNIKVAGAARPDGQVVFAGRPARVLVDGAPGAVEITGTAASSAFSATITPSRVNFPLGALWAMERVAWLEERLSLRPFEEEAIRPEIVRVALQWKLASKFTSFVCVDESTVSNGERRHVVQPTEMPEAWELNAVADNMPLYSASFAQPSVAMYRSPPMPSPTSPPPAGGAWIGVRESKMKTPSTPLSAGRKLSAAVEAFFSADSDDQSVSAFAAPAQVSKAASTKDLAGILARTQGADGSFSGDIGRTAAALIALLLLGHTRMKGDRRRTVQKAASWLQSQSTDPRAQMALAALSDAESTTLKPNADWRVLTGKGVEGDALLQVLAEAVV